MKQVQEKHVGFEVAKLAKEKKCELPTNRYFNLEGKEFLKGKYNHNFYRNRISIFPQSLLCDWIEGNSDMVLSVVPDNFKRKKKGFFTDGGFTWFLNKSNGDYIDHCESFLDRHEAMDDLLLNALKRMP